jgi:hypothetical protein
MDLTQLPQFPHPDPIAPHPMTRILSDRTARLDACAGRWILDLRDDGQHNYDLCPVPGYVCHVGTFSNIDEALSYCATNLWRAGRLLFVADKLNDDCSWPGGYDAPSIYRSNARVFREEFSRELEQADGDANGIALDIRFVTDEMIETIEALENYPVIDDYDHSALEIELQDEAWEQWAASDWRDAVRDGLADFCPAAIVDAEEYGPHTAKYWADDVLDALPDDRLAQQLQELFSACCDQTNTYWFEDGTSQYIDITRAAKGIDRHDLEDLTGLALLSPDQEWRREPYPWSGAEPSPLLPSIA